MRKTSEGTSPLQTFASFPIFWTILLDSSLNLLNSPSFINRFCQVFRSDHFHHFWSFLHFLDFQVLCFVELDVSLRSRFLVAWQFALISLPSVLQHDLRSWSCRNPLIQKLSPCQLTLNREKTLAWDRACQILSLVLFPNWPIDCVADEEEDWNQLFHCCFNLSRSSIGRSRNRGCWGMYRIKFLHLSSQKQEIYLPLAGNLPFPSLVQASVHDHWRREFHGSHIAYALSAKLNMRNRWSQANPSIDTVLRSIRRRAESSGRFGIGTWWILSFLFHVSSWLIRFEMSVTGLGSRTILFHNVRLQIVPLSYVSVHSNVVNFFRKCRRPVLLVTTWRKTGTIFAEIFPNQIMRGWSSWIRSLFFGVQVLHSVVLLPCTRRSIPKRSSSLVAHCLIVCRAPLAKHSSTRFSEPVVVYDFFGTKMCVPLVLTTLSMQSSGTVTKNDGKRSARIVILCQIASWEICHRFSKCTFLGICWNIVFFFGFFIYTI